MQPQPGLQCFIQTKKAEEEKSKTGEKKKVKAETPFKATVPPPAEETQPSDKVRQILHIPHHPYLTWMPPTLKGLKTLQHSVPWWKKANSATTFFLGCCNMLILGTVSVKAAVPANLEQNKNINLPFLSAFFYIFIALFVYL